jgi:sugar/nucleoside kinase (ribokinase family)
MKKGPIIISGTGCALADFLYTDIRFNSLSFLKYLSKKAGDGGLNPGKLVFTEDLQEFAGISFEKILSDITNGGNADSFNIGGPGLVSLIHASQMLEDENARVFFYGGLGKDDIARKILSLVQKTPLDISNYRPTGDKASPFTDVLSDHTFDNGHGERTFVNNIGAAWDYSPLLLKEDFFRSDIVCFGGTALVPPIHQNLTNLLERAKQNSCITVVNTVYDFLNEKKSPGERWPLIDSGKFHLIDLLIMDKEEALRISGENSLSTASSFFINTGISSFVITNGAENVVAFSNGTFFCKLDIIYLPVSEKVKSDLTSLFPKKGDTTGCGDNFAGGMIASIAKQLKNSESGKFDLIEAMSLGIASGGVACFYKGGTYFEQSIGEKLKLVQIYYKDYLNQIRKNGVWEAK